MPAIKIADLDNAKRDVDHIADLAMSPALTATDRLGNTKKTWAGIEDQAQLDIATAVAEAVEAGTAAAESYRDEAELARDDAVAAAGAIGPLEFYDTYADALLAAAGAQRLVEVATDETREGSRTRYWAEAGALDFVVNLDQVRKDLADPSKGPAMVGFMQNIFEAVARTMDDKSREQLSVADAGADPMGVVDATAKIQKAIDGAAGRVLRAVGTFRLSGQLNLRDTRVDFTTATLVLDPGAPSVVLGGNAASTVNPRQDIYRAYRTGGKTSVPTLRMAGSKNQFVTVMHCDYFQLYADTAIAPAVDGSIAYCTFDLGKVDKVEITNNPANTGEGTGIGGSIQWINENTFRIQRCSEFVVSGTYHHNHNRLYGGTFEGNAKIHFLSGRDNYIYEARFEGTPTVTFDAGTERNIVLNTWDSSTANFSNTAEVFDSGFDNVCMDDFLLYRHEQTVTYTDLTDTVLDTQISPFAIPRSRDLQRIFTTAVAENIVSARVPTSAGDYFRWVTVGAGGSLSDPNSRYRARIEFYDAKLRPVPANADFILTTGGALSTVSGNSITTGTNVSGAVAAILPAAITAGVRFVTVSWLGNNPSAASISQATQMYVSQFVKKSETFRGVPQTLNTSTGTGVLVSGIPTQGYARAGHSAIKSDGSAKYFNKFNLDAGLASGVGAGTTVIPVTTKAGVLVGDIVGINLDDLATHWTTVSSVAVAGQISIAAGLPSAAALGSRVVFNRWATY